MQSTDKASIAYNWRAGNARFRNLSGVSVAVTVTLLVMSHISIALIWFVLAIPIDKWGLTLLLHQAIRSFGMGAGRQIAQPESMSELGTSLQIRQSNLWETSLLAVIGAYSFLAFFFLQGHHI